MAGAKKRIRDDSNLGNDSTETAARRRKPQTGIRLRAIFLDLPAELRNKIYQLCLDTSRVLAIKDMYPHEFQAKKEEGRCLRRAAYTAPDHCRGMCARCPYFPNRIDCSFTSPRMMFEMTTYTLSNVVALENTTIGILAVNHQVRQEAGSLFYGGNTFNFGTMSSLMPFLKDRSPDSRKFINSLQLELHVGGLNWYSGFSEHRRPKAWKQAFTALKKLPHFQLKRLRIILNDCDYHFYSEGLKIHTPQMRWLDRLAEISTLDSLGVQYVVKDREPILPWCRKIDGRNTEKELWEFLAPKMLARRKGESHDAKELEHRRITLLGSTTTFWGDWEGAIVDSD